MTQVKQVVLWEPKRAPDLDKSGKPTKKEFVGKFRTKVQEGTPGAIRHKGENPAAGIKWDFWGLDVDNVFGKVRWIDVRTTDFGPKIVLFLETDKRLNQITCDYDVNNIHDIMNVFLGLGKDLATAEIAASYWVRKKTDKDGNVKTDKDGKPFWAQSMTFRYATEAVNIPGRYNFQEWKTYSEENGLAWFQEERAGKKIWNYEAELKFWMSKVVDVQRFLLKTETVLPFCWNSVTACETGALKDELPHLNNLYESIKPLYQFPFRGVWTNSENVELAPPAGYDPSNAAHAADPFNTATADVVPFPTADVTDYETTAQPGDDLPF